MISQPHPHSTCVRAYLPTRHSYPALAAPPRAGLRAAPSAAAAARDTTAPTHIRRARDKHSAASKLLLSALAAPEEGVARARCKGGLPPSMKRRWRNKARALSLQRRGSSSCSIRHVAPDNVRAAQARRVAAWAGRPRLERGETRSPNPPSVLRGSRRSARPHLGSLDPRRGRANLLEEAKVLHPSPLPLMSHHSRCCGSGQQSLIVVAGH